MTLAQSFWPNPRGSFCPVMATGGLCVAAVAVSAPGVPPMLGSPPAIRFAYSQHSASKFSLPLGRNQPE